ncbi:MAG: hypothetical protein ABII01_06050 [Candidatus Woesearchaeota archaeon]
MKKDYTGYGIQPSYSKSPFFRTLLDICQDRVQLMFNGVSEQENEALEGILFAKLSRIRWQAENKTNLLMVYSSFGRPSLMDIARGVKTGNMLTVDDIIKEVQSVVLYHKQYLSASVSMIHDEHGNRIISSRGEGLGYQDEFSGLSPEFGEINDPAPYLERLVDSYLTKL